MQYPQNIWLYNGKKVLSVWIKTHDVEKHEPITQVYGIIFNEKEEILVCRQVGSQDWILPGGHPEKDESIQDTLNRELLEEVDITVTDITPLGVQMGTLPDQPQVKPHYQVRCIAKLKELLPQTPDPDNGNMWERKFVPANEVTEYVQWSTSGDAMFKDAIALFKTKESLDINQE
jgi:ADP-ribose pyrophosphatase YjhB (NUDIX family)